MHRTPQEARQLATALLDGLQTPDGVGLILALDAIHRAAPALAREVLSLAARVSVYEAALRNAPEVAREWTAGWARDASSDPDQLTMTAARQWTAEVLGDVDAAAMLVRR